MTTTTDPSPGPVGPLPFARRYWRLGAFLRDRAAVVAACLLITVALTATLAPLISPYSPYEADNAMRFAPPGTPGHILGTDQQGRDMLARLIWGGRVSLVIGVVPTLLASALGLFLGMVAGAVRGVGDQLIMRILDVVFAFPLVL